MTFAQYWWAAVYYGFARFLPASYRPLGGVGRRLRATCARRLFASCGQSVNVEPGVDFGTGAHVSLGDHSGIGARSRIEAAHIERGVIMGPEVMVFGRNHIFTDPDTWIGRQGDTEMEPARIGEGSWIGARAIILPGVAIGRFAVIGAGAVVSRDVPDYGVAVGNPARVVRIWSERGPKAHA